MTANKHTEILSKAKGIRFNTKEVRAILDGRKTVTRRLVKLQPPANTDDVYFNYIKNGMARWGWENSSALCDRKLPYQSGDILYVRETWCRGSLNNDREQYYYKADNKIPHCRWKPSSNMPKEAARIFLKVMNVRVERLQEITSEQIDAEGYKEYGYNAKTGELMPSEPTYFKIAWNSAVKKADLDRYGWNVNPWVWVIEFERMKMSINSEKLKELDSHWSEVMELAKKYGFIGQAFGGTAILLTHENQLEVNGEKKYLDRQKRMFSRNMEKENEKD